MESLALFLEEPTNTRLNLCGLAIAKSRHSAAADLPVTFANSTGAMTLQPDHDGDINLVKLSPQVNVERNPGLKFAASLSLSVEEDDDERERQRGIGFNGKLASEAAEKACRGLLRSATFRKTTRRKSVKSGEDHRVQNDIEKTYFAAWRKGVLQASKPPASVTSVSNSVADELFGLAEIADRATFMRRSLSRRASSRRRAKLRDEPSTPSEQLQQSVVNQLCLTSANLAALQGQLEHETASRRDPLEDENVAVLQTEAGIDPGLTQAASPVHPAQPEPHDADTLTTLQSATVSKECGETLTGPLEESALAAHALRHVQDYVLEPMLQEPTPVPAAERVQEFVSKHSPECVRNESAAEHELEKCVSKPDLPAETESASPLTTDGVPLLDARPAPTDGYQSSDEDTQAAGSCETPKQRKKSRVSIGSDSPLDDALTVIAELEAEKVELEYLVESLRDQIEILEMDLEDSRPFSAILNRTQNTC